MEAVILISYIFSILLGSIVSYSLLMTLLKEHMVTDSVRFMSLMAVIVFGTAIAANILYTTHLYLTTIAVSLQTSPHFLATLLKPLTDASIVVAFLGAGYTHYILHRTRLDEDKQAKALLATSICFGASVLTLLAFMGLYGIA